MRGTAALFVVLIAIAAAGSVGVAPAAAQERLSVTVAGTGNGDVTSSPAGIDCGSVCEANFADGSSVKLSGRPDSGAEPVVWESCPGTVNGAGECEVTMDAAKEVRARFALGWHQQQPLGPEGRTSIGEVGDIKCWQANRCALITSGVAGNPGIPPGIYAYDGTGWYLYSTVCGGHGGRIAWAGPDEFWTISDQQSGQETTVGETIPQHISLCHFQNGAVVASYAEPLGVAGSYLPMDAAACRGPDECWFAGERLPGTVNVGAFHLYWNGISLNPVPSLIEPQLEIEDPGRSVVSLAYHQGALYEGVQVQKGDEAPLESPSEPSFLHEVVPGTVPAFTPQVPAAPIVYGEAGAEPEQLEGFQLSDDGEGLWAVSGATNPPADVTVLRLSGDVLQQIALDDPTPAFSPGDTVTGLAAEPGAGAVWVGIRHRSEPPGPPARLVSVHANGTVDPPVELPAEGEGIGNKGRSGPIACVAASQCWMATERGWLFHLGPDPKPNNDPAMHTLITFRPPDASLPSVPPISLPKDDSGANSEKQEETLGIQEEPLPRHLPPLLTKLHQQLIGTTLELTFVLRASAHVRLLAKRKGSVVAKTKRYTMAKGHRSLRLKLDPKRWPTKLDLQVHQVKKRGAK